MDVAVKTLKGRENVQNMVTYSCTVSAGDFDQDVVDKFVEESLKMGRFKHAHVMGLIGVCLDAGSAPYIIMPYMANGSLLKYLKKERKNIVLSEEADEDEVKSLGRIPLVKFCWLVYTGCIVCLLFCQCSCATVTKCFFPLSSTFKRVLRAV